MRLAVRVGVPRAVLTGREKLTRPRPVEELWYEAVEGEGGMR